MIPKIPAGVEMNPAGPRKLSPDSPKIGPLPLLKLFGGPGITDQIPKNLLRIRISPETTKYSTDQKYLHRIRIILTPPTKLCSDSGKSR